jgi:hypothetical protein
MTFKEQFLCAIFGERNIPNKMSQFIYNEELDYYYFEDKELEQFFNTILENNSNIPKGFKCDSSQYFRLHLPESHEKYFVVEFAAVDEKYSWVFYLYFNGDGIFEINFRDKKIPINTWFYY